MNEEKNREKSPHGADVSDRKEALSVEENGGTAKRGVSRRTLLKAGGVAIAGTAVGVVPGVLSRTARANGKKTGRRYGMLIDIRKCVNCKSCQVQCKTRGNVPIGVFRSWVQTAEVGEFPNVSEAYLPRMCNHCEDPPCVRVCPTQASYINKDGLVLIDENRCIGCKYCIAACPYQARFINQRKVADKCDMCVDRLERGELPACVDSCPFGARIFGDLNDPESEISKILANEQVEVLKPEKGTRPKVFYIGLDGRILEAAKTQEEVT